MSEHPEEKLNPIRQHISEIKRLIEEMSKDSVGFYPEMFQQYGKPEELHGQFKRETGNRRAREEGDERLTKAVSDAQEIKKQAKDLEKLLQKRLEEFREGQNY